MRMNFIPLSGWFMNTDSPLSDAEVVTLRAALFGPCGGDNNTPCIWLNRVTGQCRDYEMRPPVCREFEMGGEDCLRLRRQEDEEIAR